MPIYEYACSECGKHIEAFQKITDEPLSVCPECGGELSKLVSSTSFVLKGGGWYADGYSSKGEAGSKADPGKMDTGKKDTDGAKASTEKSPATQAASKDGK